MAAQSQTFAQAAQGVIQMAHFAGARGWVPATAGNFSVRMDAARAAVTASGGNKGELTEAGVIEAEINGPAHPRASAEAPLHLARYAGDAGVGAIAHVHTMAATVLSRKYVGEGALLLEGWELQKAFAGETTHEKRLFVPILPNDQDTVALARVAEAALEGARAAPGYLIAGHGLYVWGASVKDTLRHLEAFDHLLTALMTMETLR